MSRHSNLNLWIWIEVWICLSHDWHEWLEILSQCHVSCMISHESFFISKNPKNCLNINLGIILLCHNDSWPTVIPTGMHYPLTTKSVMIELQYTVSAEQPSTDTSFMLNPCGSSPSEPQALNSKPGMSSNDQTELSHYKQLYSQAHEDLDKLKGQAKRRSIQTVPPAICAHWNNFLGKLLAGHNWDVAYASLSPCLMIYQQSSTSMICTASYVRV